MPHTERSELVKETYRRNRSLTTQGLISSFVCEMCLQTKGRGEFAGGVNIRIEGQSFNCCVCSSCTGKIDGTG